MKRVSEETFLAQTKKPYRYWFACNFKDISKDQDEILIFERKDFPDQDNVRQHLIGNDCVLVDKVTDKAFIIKNGLYSYFMMLLYAHANNLNLLSRKTIEESGSFISDGQGYCFDALNKRLPARLVEKTSR